MVTDESETSELETNEVDTAQVQLDNDLGGNAGQSYVTTAQLEELKAMLTAETGGLQSKIDKGLNAIRRDTEAQQRAVTFEKLLADVPHENQEAMRALWQQQAQTTGQPPELQGDEREEAQRFARNAGANPSDTRIDYNSLIDPSLTVDQRQEKFIASVFASKAPPQAIPATAQPAAQAVQAVQAAGNPPIEGAKGTGAGLNSPDALRDAFIADRIDYTTFKERMTSLGEVVK
jgi:hypothetical protein